MYAHETLKLISTTPYWVSNQDSHTNQHWTLQDWRIPPCSEFFFHTSALGPRRDDGLGLFHGPQAGSSRHCKRKEAVNINHTAVVCVQLRSVISPASLHAYAPGKLWYQILVTINSRYNLTQLEVQSRQPEVQKNMQWHTKFRAVVLVRNAKWAMNEVRSVNWAISKV